MIHEPPNYPHQLGFVFLVMFYGLGSHGKSLSNHHLAKYVFWNFFLQHFHSKSNPETRVFQALLRNKRVTHNPYFKPGVVLIVQKSGGELVIFDETHWVQKWETKISY